MHATVRFRSVSCINTKAVTSCLGGNGSCGTRTLQHVGLLSPVMRVNGDSSRAFGGIVAWRLSIVLPAVCTWLTALSLSVLASILCVSFLWPSNETKPNSFCRVVSEITCSAVKVKVVAANRFIPRHPRYRSGNPTVYTVLTSLSNFTASLGQKRPVRLLI